METRKFGNRVYVPVDPSSVQMGDVVIFYDQGRYCRKVVSVAKRTLFVEQPKGFRPRTRRVERGCVKEAWRWHKRS